MKSKNESKSFGGLSQLLLPNGLAWTLGFSGNPFYAWQQIGY